MTVTKSQILSAIGVTALFSVFLTFQNCSPVSFRTVSSLQANATGPDTDFNCTPGEVEECELNGLPGTRTCLATDDGAGEWGACITDPGEPPGPPTYASCTFKGVTYAHGQSFTAYQASNVPYGAVCDSEIRTCINGSLTGSYQFLSCVEEENGNCTLGGETILNGQSIVAYLTSSVPYGQTCQSQTRVCQNKVLSGTYTFLNCTVDPVRNCTFNGQTVAHNASVTAYQASTVPFGASCVSQVRSCNNGILSGSYSASSCVVQPPATCTFDGKTIAHNGTVTAYRAPQVPFGASCESQTRTCSNGTLSGTFTAPACAPLPPATCTFDGKTIAHNASVTAYQTSQVPFGSTCTSQTRTCTNGILSGTYTASSCAAQPPATCSFNGQTVAHNASVTAYQTSQVPFGSTCTMQTRTCSNGTLSGSYTFSSCSVDTASTCVFNGKTINHGATVTAYAATSVPFGQTCQSESRKCTNGTLSGTYSSANCSVQPPANCNLNGQNINHGSSITTYAASTVAFGQTCQSQTRTCTNGTLSGNYSSLSCSVQPPATCSFNGQSVAHNASVTAYAASSVPFGQTCQSQSRTCSNGTLSGSYTSASCSVQPPANCSLNGKAINHGASVTAYVSSSVPFGQTCQTQTRTCSNGVLSGDAVHSTCAPLAPANCAFNGQAVAHGQSVQAFQTTTVTEPATCTSQNRTCNNGVLSGSFGYPSCTVKVNLKCRAFMYSACKKTNGSSKVACGYASPHGLHPEYACSGKIIAGGYNGPSGYWMGVGDISITAPWTTVPTLHNYPNARCVVHYKVGYSTPSNAHGISSIYYDGDPQPNALTTGKVNSLGQPLIQKVGCDND